MGETGFGFIFFLVTQRVEGYVFLKCTLPETNISPENRLLEKEIRIGNHHF